MTIRSIHENVKNYYHQIEQVTRESPIAAIIYSLAIKTIAIMLCAFSNILGLSVFLLSLSFDIAIISNLKDVCSKIEDTFFDIIEGTTAEQRRARRTGNFVRKIFDKVEGILFT